MKGPMPFVSPNHQCQSTKGIHQSLRTRLNKTDIGRDRDLRFEGSEPPADGPFQRPKNDLCVESCTQRTFRHIVTSLQSYVNVSRSKKNRRFNCTIRLQSDYDSTAIRLSYDDFNCKNEHVSLSSQIVNRIARVLLQSNECRSDIMLISLNTLVI